MPDFNVDVRADDRGTVITVSGELDIASSKELERALEPFEDTALIVIDLRTLGFMDSTGLGVLVRAHQRAQERGHQLALAYGSNRQVDRLLALTGLDEELLVGESPEQLLELE
jgi:anti-anti-sigma factor